MTSIVYHNRDLDGYTSGAIINMALKEKNVDVQLIGYDYGQPFPFEKIRYGSSVIMADVSLPIADMIQLAQQTKFNFTWIDHHKSAIEDFNNLGDQYKNGIPNLLDSSLSACELCWKWFYPDRPIPLAIELLGKYDTWRDNGTQYWDEVILPFQYGMRLYCTSPETFPMGVISDKHYVEEITKIGQAILKYQANVDAYAAKGAFEIDFKGYRAICMNGGAANSNAFKTVYDEAKHDLMISFRFDGERWKFSLRSTKDIDLSKLAKSFGGGGHFSAAGMEVADLSEIFGTLTSPMLKTATTLLRQMREQNCEDGGSKELNTIVDCFINP